MNIAVVLYGQPRDYLKGYNNIQEFIKTQPGCKFDFFYHCWMLNENEIYKHSPWRNIDRNELYFKKDTTKELQELYNPISFEIENQNDVSFDDSLYKNTLAFKNTKGAKLGNIDNTLFQMYSRNKARNLLQAYLEKMCIGDHYDFVLTLRFDISVMPEIRFNELNKSKVYISNLNRPRSIIADSCIIAPIDIYLQWFNIYDTLKDFIDNVRLQENISNLHENLEINPEELLFAKYIFHYENTDNIFYFQGGTI
jgi:hypothetical protein